MASIQRRLSRTGRPTWYVRWRSPDGRERTKVFERKADAERFATSLKDSILRGHYVDPAEGRVSLRDFAERWRSNQVQHRANTREAVESRLRVHLYPALGDRSLNAILRSDVQAWVTQLSTTLAPATVRLTYSYLATIYRTAVEDRLVSETPCRNIRLPEVVRPPVIPLTAAEVRELSLIVPDRYRGLIMLAAGTGLRQGEAFGLTVDRVDFLRRSLTVDRQWTGGRFGPPKTPSSARVIPLAAVTVATLADHLARYPALGPQGFVFHTGEGPLARNHFNETLKRAMSRIREGATFHDLRHFYASLLIRQGADVKVVQARLGHKSAIETLDTYGHLWPDSEDRTRSAVEAALTEELASLESGL